jgi:hypothetical protein
MWFLEDLSRFLHGGGVKLVTSIVPIISIVVSVFLFVWLYHGPFPALGLEIVLDPLPGVLCIQLKVENGSKVAAKVRKIELQILEHSMSEVEIMLRKWAPLEAPSAAPTPCVPESIRWPGYAFGLWRIKRSDQTPQNPAPTEWVPFSYDDRIPREERSRWRDPIQVLSSTEYVSPGETVRIDLLYPATRGVAVHCGFRVLMVPDRPDLLYQVEC